MHRLHHLLELGDLLAAVPARGVRRVRREEADRVVAPVVGQPLIGEPRLGDELVDREQLDRGDAEVDEVVGDGRMSHAGVGPADLLGHPVVELGHALDVRLVDHGVAPAAAHRLVALPVELVVHDDAAGRERGGVDRARLVRLLDVVAEGLGTRLHLAADRAGIGVQQQLVGVEPEPLCREPRPFDAVAVELATGDPGQGAVPDPEGVLGQLVMGLVALVVEQADVDGGRRRGVDREVRRLLRPLGAQRPTAAGPHG